MVDKYVTHYNEVRLHSAIGYVTPKDKLERREKAIWELRDRKLAAARDQRRLRRAQAYRERLEASSHEVEKSPASNEPGQVLDPASSVAYS